MGFFDIAPAQVTYPLVGLFGLWFLSRIIQAVRRRTHLTPLRGPPSTNLIFGLSGHIRSSSDSALLFEQWGAEYGSAYRVPYTFGSIRLVLLDPKAVASFLAQETTTYVRSPVSKRAVERLVGL
jgi:hypothetical protein